MMQFHLAFAQYGRPNLSIIQTFIDCLCQSHLLTDNQLYQYQYQPVSRSKAIECQVIENIDLLVSS